MKTVLSTVLRLVRMTIRVARRLLTLTCLVLVTGSVTVAPVDAAGGPSDVTGTVATRSAQAQQSLIGADGTPLTGTGVTIAVIDTGVDPTHPSFQVTGATKIVRSLASTGCVNVASTATSCVSDVSPSVDTDGLTGGHGSFVSGIAAGDDLTLTDGTRVGGAAPGARLVVISASVALIGIANAMSWVLQHHQAPCGTGVPVSVCPPIRVINNSWGASDPTIISLQDQLAAAGVITVWANGNQGGDGSVDQSNPAGEDPTPGILSVASYDDLGVGSTDGKISPTSSRGAASNPSTWPDISAPGVNIVSSCRPAHAICALLGTRSYNGPGPGDTGTFNTMSGTSWATAELSGIVAQLFQADPSASAGDIENALKSTAHKYTDGAPYQPIGPYTSSFDKGTGLADAYAAALRLCPGCVSSR
jgi:serine protease AprX